MSLDRGRCGRAKKTSLAGEPKRCHAHLNLYAKSRTLSVLLHGLFRWSLCLPISQAYPAALSSRL
jgi:hypothetical protein